MLALAARMKMDDLVPYALGFCPHAAHTRRRRREQLFSSRTLDKQRASAAPSIIRGQVTPAAWPSPGPSLPQPNLHARATGQFSEGLMPPRQAEGSGPAAVSTGRLNSGEFAGGRVAQLEA